MDAGERPDFKRAKPDQDHELLKPRACPKRSSQGQTLSLILEGRSILGERCLEWENIRRHHKRDSPPGRGCVGVLRRNDSDMDSYLRRGIGSSRSDRHRAVDLRVRIEMNTADCQLRLEFSCFLGSVLRPEVCPQTDIGCEPRSEYGWQPMGGTK